MNIYGYSFHIVASIGERCQANMPKVRSKYIWKYPRTRENRSVVISCPNSGRERERGEHPTAKEDVYGVSKGIGRAIQL